MKILFVAAEGAPFSKTGGLGDVIGALPKSLVKAGHEVAVFLPYYDMVEAKFGDQIEDVLHFEVSVGWRRQYCGIKENGLEWGLLSTSLIISIISSVVMCTVILTMVNALPFSNWLLLKLWNASTLSLTFSMFMITTQP